MPAALPGCYAYGEAHLGGGVTLRQVSDYKGDELVSRSSRSSWTSGRTTASGWWRR